VKDADLRAAIVKKGFAITALRGLRPSAAQLKS
jgi:hypothetical protein